MTATPQDHKTAASDLPETITIDTPAGLVTVPHPAHIPSAVLRKARKSGNNGDQMFDIIEALCDDDTLAILDELSILELSKFYAKWTQGADLGESSSSES